VTEPQSAPPSLELVIEPKSERFEEADGRWREQVGAFYRELRSEVGDVRRESTPEAGTKGATTDIILALGSSGALTAAVTMFKAWLDRDKTRSLDIEWTDGDQRRTLSIRGTDVGEDSFAELVQAAGRRELGATP
jgi:Effector Associated Constant Component 1